MNTLEVGSADVLIIVFDTLMISQDSSGNMKRPGSMYCGPQTVTFSFPFSSLIFRSDTHRKLSSEFYLSGTFAIFTEQSYPHKAQAKD